MKKIIALVAGVVIMLGSSTITFAQSATDSLNTEISTEKKVENNNKWVQIGVQTGNVLNLTLDNGLYNIDKVNPDIKIRDAKINILNTQYEFDKSKSSVPDDDAGDLNYDLQERYNWKESLNNLENEKHDRDEKLKSLKVDLQRQYLNALSDQEDIESLKSSINNLEKKIEKTTLRIKLGQTNSTELDSLKAQKAELNSRLNNLKAQLEAELLTIKQHLNISLVKEISLTPVKKDYSKFDDTGIEYRLDNGVKRNYELKKQENSLDLLKSKKGIYMEHSIDYEVAIRGFDININQAREMINNATLNCRINVLKAYYDLKNKEEAVEAEKLNLQVAEDNFNTIETKFKSGMVDGIEREAVKIALDQQKTKLQRAINDYMVTGESFKNLLEE